MPDSPRVEAAAEALRRAEGIAEWRRAARIALAAADEAEPMVPASLLNADCEADIFAEMDRIRGAEPESDPCLLCGFTLRGHKYVYMERVAEPLRGRTEGAAHLHCSHTLRGAQLHRAERAARERLREAFRGGFERGVGVGSLQGVDFSTLEHHWRQWCLESGQAHLLPDPGKESGT